MNENLNFNSKKEKRDFFKQEKLKQDQQSKKRGLLLKIVIGTVIVISVGLIGYVAVKESSRTLIGEKFADQGQEHVATGTPRMKYNSDPPTSGQHYATTASRGVYREETDDRFLIHNLEHGEIWISYNCNLAEKSANLINQVYAHEGVDDESSSSSTPSAQVKEGFSSQGCLDLIKKLEAIVGGSASKKLVVSPRSKNRHRIILASWNWLLELDRFDEGKIKQFIKDHLNKGPEFIPDM